MNDDKKNITVIDKDHPNRDKIIGFFEELQRRKEEFHERLRKSFEDIPDFEKEIMGKIDAHPYRKQYNEEHDHYMFFRSFTKDGKWHVGRNDNAKNEHEIIVEMLPEKQAGEILYVFKLADNSELKIKKINGDGYTLDQAVNDFMVP